MSELSDKIRSEFKKADDERDALMNTPEDIERWDNIVYGHDDRPRQVVFPPKPWGPTPRALISSSSSVSKAA